MEFEVWDTSKPDVTFEPAKITFPALGFYMEQAEKIADYINSIEVTEDNIKDVKKDLAAARKVTKALSDRRIAIKKEIMSNYEVSMHISLAPYSFYNVFFYKCKRLLS